VVKASSFENYQLGGISVGRFINRRIEVSEDADTQKGIGAVKEILSSRGVLVACGHRNHWDMIAQGIGCLQEFPDADLILPISAHYYTKGLLYRYFFEPIRSVVPNVQIFPVMRGEEKGVVNRKLSVEKSLLPKSPNKRYLKAVLGAVKTPNSLVVLSPFGTREKHQKGVRSGVRLLLEKKEMSVVCADVVWDRINRRFVVGFSSKIFGFNERSDCNEVGELFQNQFREIRNRLGGRMPF